MSLITFQNVHYGVGGPALLDDVVLGIETGERICVVGRNGAGKSTLLRLLAREIVPDEGEIRIQEGVRVGRLAQEVPQDTDGDVFDVVSDGLGELGHWLAEFHHISHAAEVDMDALSEVQSKIERANGWDLERRVTEVITKLDLPEDAAFASLSGGMKRRVLLAQALVAEPDVLLLDEPTNHLDIASIDWLEEFLRGFRGSIVFVTHDRRFLRALATRIVEIDRGQVTSWPGDYDNYLRRREERLHAEAQERARFDKFLAQEEVWIRQGIKARRTRDEGRVRRLEAMRVERAERRNQAGNVKLATTTAATSGKKVMQAENVSFAFPAVNRSSRVLVRDFDTTILRGDRIGLIGPNGVGKTTLIQLLLGQLAPQTGEVRVGTNLQVAYFDQHRTALREDWNALDNVSEGLEFIETNGGRKHVLAYLQDFLFTPERARAPITRLSGGERNRLLLAKLFAQPSNLLVMDEPTNDLDVETLELLEELLADYPGTLLLVSHDRDFLDHVVTSTLVFEGDGRIGDYVGGYSDWLRQRAKPTVAVAAKPQLTAQVPVTTKVEAPTARRKLGFKEQHELTQLPARIETLETEIAARTAAMQQPEFYRKNAAEILAANAEIAARQSELEAAYARWEQLEGE